MKEHPIPQDITNYRFHIVGSMTLKQFGEVLAGVIISLIIYQTNLIAIIKWPLIVLFFGGGLLTAFVPIEERPLSHWISTFFGIIYKPTQFFWKREQKIPEPFLYKGDESKILHVQEVDLTPARRQRIKEFLSSTKAITPDPEDLTVQEHQQIMSVMNLFETGPEASPIIDPVNVQKPDLTVRVRTLRGLTEPDPEPEIISQVESPLQTQLKTAPLQPILPDPQDLVSITVDNDSTKKDVFLETAQVAQNIEIPEAQAISVSKKSINDDSTDQSPKTTQVTEKQVFFTQEEAPSPTIDTSEATKATFNAALPFPDKPDQPNKLVGMVLTPEQEIIPNAIVEITTEKGDVVRAVKTNALGQFFITTPLASGKYVVAVQKTGLSFDPIKIELKNKIVEPLEIRSK